jgi:signal transduction histidine kinase
MSDTPKYLLSTLVLTDEQRTALEQQLLPLARSAALGALTADIAHDLANPLFAVLGHVDLLLLDAEPGSPLQQRLQLVKQTALELKDGLRALLDYARPPEGLASAALDDAVRVATALIRHGYGKELQIAATYPAEPVVVQCPPGELAQAVLHLVAAAREAAGDAGSIEVAVAADGVLRVRPAAAGGLGVVAAGRIAADHGGSLEADGDALVLRLQVRTHEVAS